jgi:hypothetical protein
LSGYLFAFPAGCQQARLPSRWSKQVVNFGLAWVLNAKAFRHFSVVSGASVFAASRFRISSRRLLAGKSEA